MLTTTKHAELITHAGPSLMWENGKLGKTGQPLLGTRPRSDTRRGLRAWLYRESQGLCVFHGGPVRWEETECCHIVATGPTQDVNGKRIRRGWVPGNIAIGCRACNEAHAVRYGAVVPMDAIARPDLIPDVWPGETALRDLGAVTEASRVA